VDLYSTSSQSASNVLLLPVSWHWSTCKPTQQPGISEHYETTWYRSVYHTISCLFTAPAYAGYSFQP